MTRSSADQEFELAKQHHAAGRMAEAEAIYRRLLAQHPNSAALLHRLGILMNQRGEGAAAAQLIERAIQLDPAAAEIHNNLGVVYGSMGRHEDALRCYRRAIQLRPQYSGAL